MKTKGFIFAALSSAAMISADYWNQGYQGTSTSQYQQSQADQNATYKQTPRTIMDDEIAKHVHDILAGNWLTGGYPNVSFDVNNGTVNLRGVVDAQDEKNRIEQAAKNIEGVKAVRSEITVGIPPINQKAKKNHSKKNGETTFSKDSAETERDRAINTRLRERIGRWNPRGYETIVITTTNGAVVITGMIDRVDDIQRISNEAKNVEGVRSVRNQVTPKY